MPAPRFQGIQHVAVRQRLQHPLQALEFGTLFDIRPGKENTVRGRHVVPSVEPGWFLSHLFDHMTAEITRKNDRILLKTFGAR